MRASKQTNLGGVFLVVVQFETDEIALRSRERGGEGVSTALRTASGIQIGWVARLKEIHPPAFLKKPASPARRKWIFQFSNDPSSVPEAFQVSRRPLGSQAIRKPVRPSHPIGGERFEAMRDAHCTSWSKFFYLTVKRMGFSGLDDRITHNPNASCIHLRNI
jgi:hypothetical protein